MESKKISLQKLTRVTNGQFKFEATEHDINVHHFEGSVALHSAVAFMGLTQDSIKDLSQWFPENLSSRLCNKFDAIWRHFGFWIRIFFQFFWERILIHFSLNMQNQSITPLFAKSTSQQNNANNQVQYRLSPEMQQSLNNKNSKAALRRRTAMKFFDSADWAMNSQYQKQDHVNVFENHNQFYQKDSISPLR